MCVIVHDTCAAIVAVLQSRYIKFPIGNDMQHVIDGFYTKWGMVQCAGAIDGTCSYATVKLPALNHTNFVQSKRLVFDDSTSCSGR